jgi:hypothetical protein
VLAIIRLCVFNVNPENNTNIKKEPKTCGKNVTLSI